MKRRKRSSKDIVPYSCAVTPAQAKWYVSLPRHASVSERASGELIGVHIARLADTHDAGWHVRLSRRCSSGGKPDTRVCLLGWGCSLPCRHSDRKLDSLIVWRGGSEVLAIRQLMVEVVREAVESEMGTLIPVAPTNVSCSNPLF